MDTIELGLENLQIGDPLRFRNLTLYPLIGPTTSPVEYLSLDEALQRRLLRITETSVGGAVPEVVVDNQADTPVLLLDGEELVGCKQNRCVNLSILVPAKSELRIPVSCVEQGRWSWGSRGFASAGRTMYARARATKAAGVTYYMAAEESRSSDQNAIWQDIRAKSDRMGTSSHTNAMADIYEQRQADTDEYCLRLIPGKETSGAIFLVNGSVDGAELFGSPEGWQKYAAKIVRSYALDAVEVFDPASSGSGQTQSMDAKRWLDDMMHARSEHYQAIGLGADIRLSADNLTGGALLSDEMKLVHLCVFNRMATAGDREHQFRRSRIGRRGRA